MKHESSSRVDRSGEDAVVTGHRAARRAPSKESVALVGCGAVNLVTALKLVRHGFAVDIFDAGPDPRADRPWQEYGCTRGGGNARMFTATEADQYSSLPAAGHGGTVFDAPPHLLGWDVRKENTRSVHDEQWVRDYESIPRWLAARYENDIFSVNRISAAGWDELFDTFPELTPTTNLRREILRIYSTPEAFRRAVRRHRAVGDLVSIYSSAETRARFPALSRAPQDALAGGILVEGFTLAVHEFVAAALGVLETNGVGLHFTSEVSGIHRNVHDVIDAIEIRSELLPVRNVVVSPGAYGNRLLAQLGLDGQIAGVLGLWHTLPDRSGQQHSIKVSRPGTVAPDANITVGDVDGVPSLVVGSGYGFVGTDVDNLDPRHLRVIQRSVDDMMRTLLPNAYEAAGGNEWLSRDPVFCVRPWTATSLGLFDVTATAGGRCIVTGGHNTGGFTQAPEVASAVLASLTGTDHPMHHLYSPHRYRALHRHLVGARARP